MDDKAKERVLRDILSEKQIKCVMSKTSGTGSQLLNYEIKSATEGMSGFLGEHFKVTLFIKEEDFVKRIHLFVKIVPRGNAPKAEFINEYNFFGVESLIFEIFEDFPHEEFSDARPWGVKALIHNHNILVLPDLSVEGYTTHPAVEYLDLEHVKVALKSLARFHAAFAKHQTQITKASDKYKLPEKYTCFSKDPQFYDCPWLRATIKLTTNFLKEFSSSIKHYPSNLEDSIPTWCIDACNDLREYEDTLNVIIHKDLWANNIMFKYSGVKPVNSVLVDFQCARYAPPAIDVMVFLYYTTSRKFREHYEKEVLDYYYSLFSEAIDEPTKRRLAILNYNRQTYFNLCEKLRPAGMMVPLAISPFILMSPQAAQESFDNPQTFHKHFMVDRSVPVISYARENEYYKARVLEIFEEFVEWHLVETVE